MFQSRAVAYKSEKDKWAQKARVVHYARLEWLANYKHSRLMVPFVSCEEDDVLALVLAP
jgi:hypothetical protein